ncbi:MAG: UDP-N-acetylglucosamine--N-acetylmuramyl-(pentapeptide) pyrophosphoryl-undecaprenol N-acetylglucosamine transferase [Campylobacteraceae bacterium]|nr:UDP-N-acetylglucosamine--N-acetylmuramyl-(pentapeptide) pyrophosphoryl-undecaprenol N-acetylglucosamine transferase [Campylobacteraceae bacterium]
MIAITGGGTGGHLAIAKALKDELNSRGIKPVYIGSLKGQDRTWFENENGFEQKYFLKSQGVVNKRGLKKLFALSGIIKSSFTCRSIFKKHQIKSLICVGGYSAAPASLATVFGDVNLYIHEQNAIIGRLNRLLKPFCKEFFSSYEKDSTVKDYPVNKIFFEKRKDITELKTIIFLGGSQGSTAINKLALALATQLNEKSIKIIHQCGKNDFVKMKNFYEQNNIYADVFDFSKNLINKISQADFAISRSGASTLWELCALAIPSLFIPYPYAASDHQYSNAKMLADKNLALLKRESEIDEKNILHEIEQLDLKEMSKNLKETISLDGAKKIIDTLLGKN